VKEAPSLTLTEQLQIAISNMMAGRQTTPVSSNDMAYVVKKEISLFSGGGSRELYCCTHRTQNAYNFLMTIPPASIEPEAPFRQLAYSVLNLDHVRAMPYWTTCCSWASILPKLACSYINDMQFPRRN